VTAGDGTAEVRAHLVQTDRPWPMREGGWAIADDAELETGVFDDGAWARGRDGLVAAVVGLHGWGPARASVHRYRDANAMGAHSATPALEGRTGTGRTVAVALHVLDGGGAVDPQRWRDRVRVHVDGTRVRVEWASGRSAEFDLATFVPWDGHPGLTGPRGEAL
jgi:hypothetical protein